MLGTLGTTLWPCGSTIAIPEQASLIASPSPKWARHCGGRGCAHARDCTGPWCEDRADPKHTRGMRHCCTSTLSKFHQTPNPWKGRISQPRNCRPCVPFACASRGQRFRSLCSQRQHKDPIACYIVLQHCLRKWHWQQQWCGSEAQSTKLEEHQEK